MPKAQVLPPLSLEQQYSLVVDLLDLGCSGRCMEDLAEAVVAGDTAAKFDIERVGLPDVGMDLRS